MATRICDFEDRFDPPALSIQVGSGPRFDRDGRQTVERKVPRVPATTKPSFECFGGVSQTERAGMRPALDVERARLREVDLIREASPAQCFVGEFAVDLVIAECDRTITRQAVRLVHRHCVRMPDVSRLELASRQIDLAAWHPNSHVL